MPDHEPLDWMGSGYDPFGPSTARPRPSRDDHWGLLQMVLGEARQGRLGPVPQLVSAIASTRDPVFRGAACEVVGDAGGAAELEALVQSLDSAEFEQGYDIARALVSRGRLVDVPAVFFFYEMHQERKDAQVVQPWLNWWLCEGDETFAVPGPGGDASWAEYRTHVGQRYFALWNALGTNLVHVQRGRPFDLAAMVERMLLDLQRGLLSHLDRHVFEANTGLSCSRWYEGGRPVLLRAAADLERFADSGRAQAFPAGQRAFMGYMLEDVKAAEEILAGYPQNGGMGVPFVRTTFDVDEIFALEYGFEWQTTGYFYEGPNPPPTALVPSTTTTPWLSLHTCLREAKIGNREPLEHLAQLLGPGQDSMFQTSAVELLADAADDRLIAPWREAIARDEDPDSSFDLCCGLLRRGLLRDVPLVLECYREHHDHPHFEYLQTLFGALLGPIMADVDGSVDDYCRHITRRCTALRESLHGDGVPLFRGGVLAVRTVAEHIAAGAPGLTLDLRSRFESATGIDCSSWFVPRSAPERAVDTARRFLDGDEVARYQPGRLYFFGHEIALES